MEQLKQRAQTLIEALPYIRKWSGKTIVIKYGGNAMTDDTLQRRVTEDMVLLRYVGINVVVVHGGGPAITSMLDRLDCPSRFIGGMRVTDSQTMDVAQMVLVGLINKQLVSLLNTQGARAVGVSGKDDNLIRASKMLHEDGDLGFVGQIESINTDVIDTLTEKNYSVVVSSVGTDASGQSYNINADIAAGELAGALQAQKLIVLTNVRGILRDRDDESSLMSELSLDDARQLLEGDVVSEGMIPKLESCITALEKGVPRAHLIDGTIPHSLLMELFTDSGIGTMIQSQQADE